jgi:hypothetical protein
VDKSMLLRGSERRNRDDSAAFIKRLEEVASNFRSRAAFALAAGIPASSLQSYFEGSEPTRATLYALADAGRVSLEWLACGRGYKDPHPQVPDGYLAIPFYDIRKAGGYVYPLVSEDVVDFTYLKLEWFSYPGIEPGKLFLIEVTDSRVAEISNGDFAVVDAAWASSRRTPTKEISRGTYLVSQRARLSVQRVVSGVNGVIELSGSHRTSDKRRRIGDDGFFVHGRIIWYSHCLPTRRIPRLGESIPTVHLDKDPAR